jgi:glycosyltransferase involved in cell wall biosynthesis
LLVPGDPATATGGYLYDRQIVAGLAELGWRTRVHALDASFPQPTPAALREARRVLEELPPGDLVVVDGLALAGLGRVLDEACAKLDIVALIHHPLALETGLAEDTAARLQRAETEALAHVERVIVTSQWTARALGGYGVPIAKLRVVEPGFDTHSASGAPPTPRAAGTRVHLLCVASLVPRKGHRMLIGALSELRDRDWHLACVGDLHRDPETVTAVERQIEWLRLGARVSLQGELDGAALARCYERANLFVLPSYFEGYGLALAAALAHGLPIVSTTGGAIPETVPAAASVLVPPGDDRALARALAQLLDDPGERARLAAAAVAARAALPTWQEACAKFAAALDGVGMTARA